MNMTFAHQRVGTIFYSCEGILHGVVTTNQLIQYPLDERLLLVNNNDA